MHTLGCCAAALPCAAADADVPWLHSVALSVALAPHSACRVAVAYLLGSALPLRLRVVGDVPDGCRALPRLGPPPPRDLPAALAAAVSWPALKSGFATNRSKSSR